MAGSYNKISIIGNVGKDPEMRLMPSGDSVAEFTVAVNERRRGQDGQTQESTMWFRVSAFGRTAEIANQYLRKGSAVYVEGPVSLREYTDREGVNRASLDVRARELRMLDRRSEGGEFPTESPSLATSGAAKSGAAATSTGGFGSDDSMDDIPF